MNPIRLTLYWLSIPLMVYRQVAMENLFASMIEASLLDAIDSFRPRAVILHFPKEGVS